MSKHSSMSAGSYSSEIKSVRVLLREVQDLYLAWSRNIEEQVRYSVNDFHLIEKRVAERCGIQLHDKDVLEIGPGQNCSHLICWALSNRAVGIDRDILARGWRPGQYLRMLRSNGPLRAGKTMTRKLLGLDRKHTSELKRQLGITRLPKFRILQMDMTRMTFEPSSFDFVYSRSVLHCLPDPGAALEQVARVLRPGGVAYITLHLYSSDTGHLDTRVYTEKRSEIPLWAHLRPHLHGTINPPNLFLSKLRLAEWRELFGNKMPGSEFILTRSLTPGVDEAAVSQLQDAGELREYSPEELLTGQLVAIWRKPAH